MKSLWPKKIELQFLAPNDFSSGVIVNVSLIAKEKNNPTVGSFFVGQDGVLSLTSRDFDECIKRVADEFPMDFYGGLDSCIGLEVLVENEGDLLERVKRLQEFFPESAARLAKLAKDAENWRFCTLKERLETPIREQRIVIELQECDRSSNGA